MASVTVIGFLQLLTGVLSSFSMDSLPREGSSNPNAT